MWEPADSVPTRPSTPVRQASSKAGSADSLAVQRGRDDSDDDFDQNAWSNPLPPRAPAPAPAGSPRNTSRSSLASGEGLLRAKSHSPVHSEPDWLADGSEENVAQQPPVAAAAYASAELAGDERSRAAALEALLQSAGQFSGGWVRESGHGGDASMVRSLVAQCTVALARRD